MKILVTAGNTVVYIDRVRCITNIFTGRTGTQIALTSHQHGHDLCLLTSHPEVVSTLQPRDQSLEQRWRLRTYKSFDELQAAMKSEIAEFNPDAVVHCAAVSDYESAGIFAPSANTTFDPASRTWHGREAGEPTLDDMSGGKVKSNAGELWLRLVRTPKIVDQIRQEWGFKGILVKFKLEVDVDETELLRLAEESRVHSTADLMVANKLDGVGSWALVGPVGNEYIHVKRSELAGALLEQIERLHAG